MKFKILDIYEMNKNVVTTELSNSGDLTHEQINEYLDILNALKNGQHVFNITTPDGQFLIYVTAKPSDFIKKTNKKK
jgi:hypothetical protein